MSGGTNDTNVSQVATSYSQLNGQLAAVTAPNINNGATYFYCPGTLSGWSVTASTSPGSGNDYDVTIRINGESSDVTCQISNSGTTCSSTTVINVPLGGWVNVQIAPNSNPTAANFDWSATYTYSAVTPAAPIQ